MTREELIEDIKKSVPEIAEKFGDDFNWDRVADMIGKSRSMNPKRRNRKNLKRCVSILLMPRIQGLIYDRADGARHFIPQPGHLLSTCELYGICRHQQGGQNEQERKTFLSELFQRHSEPADD